MKTLKLVLLVWVLALNTVIYWVGSLIVALPTSVYLSAYRSWVNDPWPFKPFSAILGSLLAIGGFPEKAWRQYVELVQVLYNQVMG